MKIEGNTVMIELLKRRRVEKVLLFDKGEFKELVTDFLSGDWRYAK